MKTIWVTQRLIENESYPETREALDIRWAKYLYNLDLISIPVPIFSHIPSLLEATKPVGLLLTGGNDLSTAKSSELSLLRDQFEGNLVDCFLKMNLPILGVCRGMQLIIQKFGEKIVPLSEHSAKHHYVTTNSEQSRYFSLPEKLKVNSYHNFAVQLCNDDFLEVAKSEDGFTEAIEHKSKRIAGIMWHPERNDMPQEYDLEIFRRTFEL